MLCPDALAAPRTKPYLPNDRRREGAAGWVRKQLAGTGAADAAAEAAPSVAASPLALAPAVLSRENTAEVSIEIVEPSAEAGFRAITYDTDTSYEADTVTEEPSEGYTLGEASLVPSQGLSEGYSSEGYNLGESSDGLGLAEMSAHTLTDSEARSCNHSSPLHELSGCTSAGTHSPPSVCIDFGACSSEGSPILDLTGSLGGSLARSHMLSSHKPEAVLLPPRLAALALKRGDTRMSMALGGAGRQIERRKQHRFATWMTSFEERIRADIALSFAHHDGDGSGGIDEERLRLCCTEVWPKIAKLMRDAPEFQQARYTYYG